MRSFQRKATIPFTSNTTKAIPPRRIFLDKMNSRSSAVVAAAAASESSISPIMMADSPQVAGRNDRRPLHALADAHAHPDATTIAVRRHVHFSDDVMGILVPSLKDMSSEEKNKIWYNDEDKSEFKNDIMKDARHLRRCLSTSTSISPESECTTARGIEHLASNDTLNQLSDAKSSVIEAVLYEQDCQRSRYGHVADPLQVALASSANSLGAKKTAIAHALIDQEFVLSSYQRQRQRHGEDGRADQLRHKLPQDERAHATTSSQPPILSHRPATVGGIQQGRVAQEAPMMARNSSSSGIARWSALGQGH